MNYELTTVFTLGIALAALVISVITAVRKGSSVDAAVADKLAKMHDPQVLDRLEAAYQTANAPVVQLVNTVAALLKVVAPFTPIKSDDAAAKLLEDIQTPGADPATPAGSAG